MGVENLKVSHPTILCLFKEYQEREMLTARKKAWTVKEKWEKGDQEYKENFIRAMVNQDWNKDQPIKKEEIRGVYDLLAFFSNLSAYDQAGESIKKLNYFYYSWWRKFLYEIANKYDSKREQNINAPGLEGENYSKENLLNNIQYTPKLQAFDKICGF